MNSIHRSMILTLASLITAVGCSSHFNGDDTRQVPEKLDPCDSLQIISRDRSGDSIVSTLFHCGPIEDQTIISYSSIDKRIAVQKFHSNPDSMICIVYNDNGSVWSRTTYIRNVPVGEVYCVSENGDTIQYYYHSEHLNGKIVFTALRNIKNETIEYTGNPIHYVSISSDKVHSGDSVWVNIEVCGPTWVSHASQLVESMDNRNERLVHDPVIQTESLSSFLLVPSTMGVHSYHFEVELIGPRASDKFNRTFRVSVDP